MYNIHDVCVYIKNYSYLMTSELLIFDCASNDLFHEQSKQNNDIDTT